MFFGEEPLSLANFEPAHALPPYLNTPRSVEACRLHGINPIELVEVSIDEFRKDFPNDPDAAQRRFERIDGARRRMLATVLEEWKHLVDSGWVPKASRPKSAKERIIDVPIEAHSTLLEIQAAKFRKIEMDQMNALKRMMKMELKAADHEMKSKQILGNHAEIKAKNDALKKERQAHRDQLYKEQLENKKKQEQDYMEEVKRLQQKEAEEAKQKLAEHADKLQKEKEGREKREWERLQREEYTKQLKEGIMKNLQAKADAKKRLQDARSKESQDRVREAKEAREAKNAGRRKELEDRQIKARLDLKLSTEEQREAMLQRLADDEAKRQRMKESRSNQRSSAIEENNEMMREKMQKVKEMNENAERDKSNKALSDLQYKEMLAKQELDKIRDAQMKRRSIKSIRQEAYEIAATRRKKADDYKMRLQTQAIKNKNDKCDAIRTGFLTLSHMRMKMKDIMLRAKTELKNEMHQLRHKDEFSPDRVVRSALAVTQAVLFPSLERTFGMVNQVSAEQQRLIDQTLGDSGFAGADADANALGGPRARSISPEAFRSSSAGNRATTAPNLLSQSTGNLGGARSDSPSDTQRHGGGMSRGALPKTLPIQTLTKAELASSLEYSKLRLEQDAAAAEATKRASESHEGRRIKKAHSLSRSRSPGSDFDYEGGADGNDDYSDNGSRGKSASPTTTEQRGRHRENDDSGRARTAGSTRTGTAGGGKDKNRKGSAGGTGAHGRPPSSPNAVTTALPSPADRRQPPGPEEFRREYSSDHPLAGGKGKYNKERAQGKNAVGAIGLHTAGEPIPRISTPGQGMTPSQASREIERLSLKATTRVVDRQRQLETLRKEQSDALLRVLEEERAAEEAREKMTRAVGMNEQEVARLELVFAEERKRASERIVRLTKEHEARIKDAVLAMMSLGKEREYSASEAMLASHQW